MKTQIQEDTIDKVVYLSTQIPEFDRIYPKTEYEKRLLNKPHLILVAYINQKAVGYKVGYQDGNTFYSWVGGVLPNYRKLYAIE